MIVARPRGDLQGEHLSDSTLQDAEQHWVKTCWPTIWLGTGRSDGSYTLSHPRGLNPTLLRLPTPMPDRQLLLFSATMPMKVERLANDALSGPVRIRVGEAGMANEDISQVGAEWGGSRKKRMY